mgnify:CR=1 FL=1
MRVDTLEAYNVPQDILAIWRESVGENLLPVQERAVKEFGLFGDANLIVFSPTSSGKTFVGEMAAVRAARSDTKVFYLVPQKALAVEKYEGLRARYAGSGIEVVVSSRDRREFDDAIAEGRFHIAVVVFEKLSAMLVACPKLLGSVGLVVVDELQLITDETRGPALELLLTKLKMLPSKPRIVGLSAVLGKAQLLADWLGAKLLVDVRRPVELRKGVLCRGAFTYREHNSGARGTEEFADMGGELPQELLLAAAEDIVRRGEQVLVFVADRASTVLCAQVLADRVSLPSLNDAIEELLEHEETHAQEALRVSLNSSIAFHNADLSPEERALVEKYFRSGGIRALFSTSTLAMGMNLPVKNVVLEAQKWGYAKWCHQWGREPLSRSEYENMSGRAGRLGLSKEFGRSILVTKSPFQAEAWLQKYVEGDFEEIVPTLKEAPMEDLVVDLLASGMVGPDTSLRELLMSSFTGATWWTQKMSKDELDRALDQAIGVCVEGGLAERVQGQLRISDLGHACAAKGIGVRTTVALALWARASKGALRELEALTVAAQSPAGSDVYVSMPKNERWKMEYRAQLLQRATDDGIIDRAVFTPHTTNEYAASYDDSRAFKKALMLCDWIAEVPTKEIERRYQVWAGAIRRVGEDFAWIIEALGAIAQACGWPESRKTEFAQLSERLMFGVRADAILVAKLRVPGLGRVLMRRVVDAGFANADAMRAAGPDLVRKAVNHRGAFDRLWKKLTDSKPGLKKATPYPPVAEPPVLIAAEPPAPTAVADDDAALIVDLRDRRVIYRGHEIPTRPPNNLQRQPLLALAVLASRPGQVVRMAELAEQMAALGGMKKRPLTPEPKDLRYKLLRPFKKALAGSVPDEEIDGLVENVAGVGVRLTVAAQLVRVRVATAA